MHLIGTFQIISATLAARKAGKWDFQFSSLWSMAHSKEVGLGAEWAKPQHPASFPPNLQQVCWKKKVLYVMPPLVCFSFFTESRRRLSPSPILLNLHLSLPQQHQHHSSSGKLQQTVWPVPKESTLALLQATLCSAVREIFWNPNLNWKPFHGFPLLLRWRSNYLHGLRGPTRSGVHQPLLVSCRLTLSPLSFTWPTSRTLLLPDTGTLWKVLLPKM